MDLNKYSKYTNLSKEEVTKLATIHLDSMGESTFEYYVSAKHERREREKKYGRAAIRTRPLVQVLSVNVQRTNENKDSSLVIYGKICGEIFETGVMVEHLLFHCERSSGEILGSGPSNKLSLIGPKFSCWPPCTCTPLSMINVSLYDGNDNVFAKERFCLDDAIDDYEEVKCREISCAQGYLLTVKYILIPFGVSCRLSVEIIKRRFRGHFRGNKVNVNGKIIARYGNIHENCFERECVLFEKQGLDFEQAEFEIDEAFLKLPRCWVASPAHSPLIVTLELWEFETGREIVHDTIELLPSASGSAESFLQEEMGLFIMVQADWFDPNPYGRCKHSPSLPRIPTEDIDEIDTDGEDESSDEESDDDSNLERPQWVLNPHKIKLWPSPAVEIFSIFIGREKSKVIQVYGSIEVLIDDRSKYHILNGDEKHPLRLQDNENTTPIHDGSRLFENSSSLGMKVDIKDVDGPLAIKGFVNWHAEVLASDFYNEKQICSSILGKNGFIAVHYSIFSEAVLANIKVYLKKAGVDVYPKVSGSLIAQYSCFNYSTRYNKDYYRIVLFKRSQSDSVETSSNQKIPLSRSMVVVPVYSSLIFNVDLSFGDSSGETLSHARSLEFKIDEGAKTIDIDDYSLCMQLDWCEIK